MIAFGFLLYFSLNLITADTARILAVFPVPMVSHQNVFETFTQALAKRGHQVFVVTAKPVFVKEETPGNLTEIDVHDAMHEGWNEVLDRRKILILSGNDFVAEAQRVLFQRLINLDVVKRLLEEDFDILFVEEFSVPLLSLSHKLKTQVIQISSFGAATGMYETIGAPVHPLIYAAYTRQNVYNITKWQELTELYNDALLRHLNNTKEIKDDEMLKDLNFSVSNELRNNVDMVFLYHNYIFDNYQPVPPGVVYFEGARDIIRKELPENLKSYLDSSTKGVIYVNFSTIVTPRHFKAGFLAIFSRLPYNVLMRWREDIPGKSKNVRLAKWLPQVDVLAHPNTKLFINQAGLQATLEAITFGVPVIGLPLWRDQFLNAENYAYHGIGIKMDANTLTGTQLEEAIVKLITDESYRMNMVKFRTLLRDQRIAPLYRAVWWTEHVLKHGSRHLRAPAANQTWAEFFELELVGILLFFCIIFFITVVVVVEILWRFSVKVFTYKKKYSKNMLIVDKFVYLN